MTKKTLVGLLVVAGGSVVAAFALLPRSQINRENFEKVEVGMDISTVRSILGGPPRDETTGSVESTEELREHVVVAYGPRAAEVTAWSFTRAIFPAGCSDEVIAELSPRVWKSNWLIIRVDLEDGRVWRCRAMSVRPVPESPLAKLRRWLRL